MSSVFILISPYLQVAAIISTAGVMLIIGKCIYGAINDIIGTYKANYIFITFLILGLLGCCLCGYHNKVFLFLGLLTLGLGFPINNIGVPLWAADMSDDQTYPKTLKSFQLAYTLGTNLFSIISGLSADIFGSYVPAYGIFTMFSLVFMYMLQRNYRKQRLHSN